MAKKRAATKTRPTKRRPAKRKPPAKRAAKPTVAATDPLRGLPVTEPLTEAPPAPERLGTHGLACWRRIAPLLCDLRLLTPLDLEALEAMCHQWHDYLHWHLAIQKNPSLAIVEYESGARQKSPEATLRDAAYDRWLKLLPRFGLSPEHLRKLNKLKPTASKSGGGKPSGDPVAEFAAKKYES